MLFTSPKEFVDVTSPFTFSLPSSYSIIDGDSTDIIPDAAYTLSSSWNFLSSSGVQKYNPESSINFITFAYSNTSTLPICEPSSSVSVYSSNTSSF